jgi:SPX domain protein involved in polyphosphate accumulation
MDIVERYEHKFLVDESLVPEIRSFARSTSTLDRHARADGAYTIRSLYFDTPSFDLYAANEREQGHRFKIRARMYPDTATSPCFLEVKRRFLDVIVKTRAAVPCDHWRDAIDCDSATLEQLPARSRDAVIAFAAKVHAHHLDPVVLVQYEREAYVSDMDSYARLTLDRNICVQPMTDLDFTADPKRWRHVDHAVQTQTSRGVAVLELKFERRPPAWMHAMVRRLELVRYSFSKYCYGILNELTLPGTDRTSTLAAAGGLS